MVGSWSARALPVVLVALAVALIALSSVPAGLSLEGRASGSGVGAVASPASATPAGSPSVQVLAKFAATPFTWNLSFPLTFTVPSGVAEVVYVWALGGNFTPYLPPVLPSGMSVATSIGFEGIADGNLTPGTYATNLSYAGWINIVSIAVYGIAGENLSVQSGSVNHSTTYSLPMGAGVYIGVESTGGTYPVTDPSITLIDEEAAALEGGATGVIGRQYNSSFSFSTGAVGYGIAALGVWGTGNATEPTGLPELLAGLSATPFTWNVSYPLTFTVPAGLSDVLYAWALGGNFSAYEPPTLPSGMSIAAFLGPSGMAVGDLSPGTYSSDLAYTGWTNVVSIAVYGIPAGPGGSAPTLQFSSVSQRNQHPLSPEQVNLTLPSGASEYLAVQSTGGTYAVTDSSLTFVNEEAAALAGGYTALIGEQFNSTVSFTTVAVGASIVAVAIGANVTGAAGLSVNLLASFSLTTGGWNLSFPLDFYVPVGVSQVLYVWALGGNYSAFTPPSLPTGMTVEASVGFSGMALGNLSSGSYTSDLFYAGWTNYVSLAVYGVYGGANATFTFGSVAQTNPTPFDNETVNLSLPAGGATYLGVESTGGTFGIGSTSLAFVDEWAWALRGGTTGLIGRQATDAFSLASDALGVGIVAVGIFPTVAPAFTSVTFTESGLPSGTPWTLALGGEVTSVPGTSISFTEIGASAPYLVSGPAGYRVAGLAPSGVVRTLGAPVTEKLQFVRARTASLTFSEAGLASGSGWCVQLGGWLDCGSTSSLTFPDLTPGSYGYAVEPIPLFEGTAKVGHSTLGLRGTLSVSRSTTVAVRFSRAVPVTFHETGLSAGSSWTVTVKGETVRSTNATLVLDLPAGTYSFRAVGPHGTTDLGSVTTFVVGGSPSSVTVTFRAKG